MSVFNRASRSVLRKPSRTMLVVLALGFAMAIIISVDTSMEASNDKTQEVIDETIADTEAMVEQQEQFIEEMQELSELQLSQIVVRNMSFGTGELALGTITQEVVDNIMALENTSVVVPMISQPIKEDVEDEGTRQGSQGGGQTGGDRPGGGGLFRNPDYTINGVMIDTQVIDKYQIVPSDIVSGRTLLESDTRKVLIEDDLTQYFGADVGDLITIEETSFEIIGLYSSNLDEKGVYMTISDAQVLFGLADDEYTSLDVYANNSTNVESLVYDISQLYPSFFVNSYESMSSRFADRMATQQDNQITEIQTSMDAEITQLEEGMDDIESTGSQIVFILTITAALIVLFMMLFSVKERTKEIGVLKALGFNGGNVMSQFVIEGVILGFLGGAIGIMIGWIGAPLISDALLSDTDVYASSAPGVGLMLQTIFMSVSLGAVGSLYPAWEASRKSPVEAMRHE